MGAKAPRVEVLCRVLPCKLDQGEHLSSPCPASWGTSISIYSASSLLQSADLPPDRSYVFGYHPHGIIGVGAVSNFGTEATEFADSFPGLRPHLLTLANNFQIPVFRDVLMGMGLCSVSRRSCERILRKGKGHCITIVVGGATESLKAKPGTADLTLRRRLGFIKIAVRNGASLVPVFSFVENDIFQQLSNEKGTAVFTFQKRFQALFGFTLPLFHGRGIFNYHIGFLPYRHPIVSVGESYSPMTADERMLMPHSGHQLDDPFTQQRPPTHRKKCCRQCKRSTSRSYYGEQMHYHLPLRRTS